MSDIEVPESSLPGATYITSHYPQVIYEEADHEVVVVNLLQGTYYYLTGTAAFIWMGLHAGLTTHQVVEQIEAHVVPPVPITSEVQSFIESLVSLCLVAPASALAAHAPPIPSVSEYISAKYESPEIETYSDLQDILLLDPVHDVDESGWPTPKRT